MLGDQQRRGRNHCRASLADARAQIGEISQIAARRMGLIDLTTTSRDRAMAGLRDLIAAYQAREAALKQETAAYQAESTRWSTYYTVRLARAQAECSAINGGGGGGPTKAPASRAKGKKKQ